MRRQRVHSVLALAGVLAVILLNNVPAPAMSLDSDSKIIGLSEEEPLVATELNYYRSQGYTDEPATVTLTHTGCTSNGCTRFYLVTHQFVRAGAGYTTNTVFSQVALKESGEVLWVELVEFRRLENDRDGRRRGDDRRQARVEDLINEALKGGAFDVQAIRDHDRQSDLVACVAHARAAFPPRIAGGDPYPPFTYAFVVRRTVDPGGEFPEVKIYMTDGYSNLNVQGEVWTGKIKETLRGAKSSFPVSEIMDYIRVSPEKILEGPFTPPCLKVVVEQPKK